MAKPQGKVQKEFKIQGTLSLECVTFETSNGVTGITSGNAHKKYIGQRYSREGRDEDGNKITFVYQGLVNGRPESFSLRAHDFVKMGRPESLNLYRTTIIAPVSKR